MRTTITTMLVVASVCATSVHGQVDNCAELLRLSRTTSRTVENRSQFTRTVNNVCNEIRRARSEKRSLNLDLRIMGLGEGGGSNVTTDSIYTKYCSDQSAEHRDDSNYQQYLEGIEPGAYAAYQACTTAASNDVEFQMLTSPTRDVLELVVFHETNRPNGRADMSWSASDPVACQWESFRGNGEVESPQRRILEDNERTRLKCRRDSFNAEPIREPDYVNIIRDGGNATINIPWRKYGPDNNPVQTLDEIQRDIRTEVARLQNAVTALRARAEVLEGEVRVQSGVVGLPYSSEGRPLAERRGEARLRGIVGGRVDFPMAFAKIPVVHMALSGADIRRGANVRLQARVTSVDQEGFEYELFSWADTHAFTASASWVAVVP